VIEIGEAGRLDLESIAKHRRAVKSYSSRRMMVAAVIGVTALAQLLAGWHSRAIKE
jgi:hypothetical protein